jgi:hypothetical protein
MSAPGGPTLPRRQGLHIQGMSVHAVASQLIDAAPERLAAMYQDYGQAMAEAGRAVAGSVSDFDP